ncbi:MAG: peptidylprolyl isomerase [Methylococcaceae bacterium]|jgi:hypothetical protein
MSTQVPVSPSKKATDSMVLSWPNWLREPLLHFVLLGGLLFAVDFVVSSQQDDPLSIVVTTEVDDEVDDLFKAARGREPNTEELTAMHRVWLDNEILYREGLAMQLDKGDTAIRERVIFKALSVIDANVKLPAYDDNTLRKWFEGHRNKYDQPARYDFEEAVLAGDNAEKAVRDFVLLLNTGAPGDAQAGLRLFKDRPYANLEQSYGVEFVKTLEAAPVGVWQAQSSKTGWKAIRLNAVKRPEPAAFEALRGVILQDWTDATLAEQRTAAVRVLGEKYTVKFEAAQ